MGTTTVRLVILRKTLPYTPKNGTNPVGNQAIWRISLMSPSGRLQTKAPAEKPTDQKIAS